VNVTHFSSKNGFIVCTKEIRARIETTGMIQG